MHEQNGWYFDRLLMKDEAFYDGMTLLHADTIYKDSSRLIDLPRTAIYYYRQNSR